ncbi:MAG TPA: ankyrin repeat domain-containing protein [Chthonomonadaceae bacterium]|nr:ankyrin repeat domain-containing protein [Chthonomonadaceae bacterium]
MKGKGRPRASLITAGVFILLSAGIARQIYVSSMRERHDRMLVAAVNAGYVDAVKDLLEEGADADTRQIPPDSHFRAKDLCYLILHAGAQPPLTSQYPTALLLACRNGNYDVIKLLLEHGAQANARSISPALQNSLKSPNVAVSPSQPLLALIYNSTDFAHGISPRQKQLRRAYEQWMDGIRLLLAQGADVNARDISGETPLVGAAYTGNRALVQLLLDHGADIQIQDASGGTALTGAISSGNPDLVQMLRLHGAKFRQVDLVTAARTGNPRIVRMLLSRNADVNVKTPDGVTPLMAAVDAQNPEIVRLLLAQGADVNARDTQGETVLIRAVQNTRADIVALLLARGADVHARDNKGDPVLLDALGTYGVQKGRADIVSLLLARGADVCARGANGQTALLLAPFAGADLQCARIIHMLVSRGADVNARNRFGLTPMIELAGLFLQTPRSAKTDTPVDQDLRKSMQILLSHGAVVEAGSLIDLAKEQNPLSVPRFSYLIAQCKDLNRRSKSGETLLTWAVRQSSPKIVALLLKQGADVNAKNAAGQTPLLEAAALDRSEIVPLLLAKGVDVNARSPLGETALMLAAEVNDVATVRLLLQHGADARVHSASGQTAVNYANGYPPVLALLQDKDIRK